MSPSSRPAQNQERRPVRRSRYGCRNCKLRKVKCDEDRPQCKRCIAFGLRCNFVPNTSDLQSIVHRSTSVVSLGSSAPRAPVTSAVWTSDASSTYMLDAQCQALITRYLGSNLVTPNDPNMAQVNQGLLALTFTRPYLMHASLAVALAHDYYLNSSARARRSLKECYHWSRSTSLFTKRLQQSIVPTDKDAIWGTAAAISLLCFATPDSATPEDSWPMKPATTSDLSWLRLGRGKMSLWELTNPLRPDSIFRVMAGTYAQMNAPMPVRGIDGISTSLALLCNLDDSSTAETNAYFNTLHALAYIQRLPDSQVTVGHTELFSRSIHGPFETLLRGKDAVALLLLYLWYRKAGRAVWWIELRAKVECPSICLYLVKYHGGFGALVAVLQEDSWRVG